jgi:FkbM family methyltransferase
VTSFIKNTILQMVRKHAQGRSFLSGKISSLCEHYLRFYNNVDWDFERNGEAVLVRRLGVFDFQTVFDVGANRGDWLERALRAFPRARIHAFEIAKPTYQKLDDLFSNEQQVVLNCYGLSDRCGPCQIHYCAQHDDITTMLDSIEERNDNSELIDAETLSGDSYCESRGITHIDFIKIDTEGADYLVLKGFDQMFSRQRVEVVQCEYSRANAYSGCLLRDYYHFFQSRGYRIGKLLPQGVQFQSYHSNLENFTYSNYVAVKADRSELIKATALR